MEITCNRCHQPVEAESCYCAACGLPQLVYTSETNAAQTPQENVTEAVRDASSVQWRPALRAAMLVAIPAGFLTVRDAASLVSIGTLLAFVIVCSAVLLLRYREPNLHRPFKTPVVWLTAPLGIISCFYLMSALPWRTWERLLIWLAIGLAIYFLYGRSHSKLAGKS